MDQKHERGTGADPTNILLCCNILLQYEAKQKQRGTNQTQSEAAGAQIHSQRHSLTAQHLTPLQQPSFRLQAHKPAGGAITGEA